MDDQPFGLLWSASRLRGNDGAVVNDGAVAAAAVDSTGAFARVTASVDTTANLVPLPLPVARTSTASVAPTPVFAPPQTSGSGGAGAVGGGVLALLLVVALILGLAWLARRMPGVGVAGAGNPALRVVGSLALGPRDRVVVVEIGQTQLLLGVGPGGTRTLHTLDAPLPLSPNSGPSPFAQLLSQHFGKKP
ncbi:flagellar biosynthetic protein FliO [Lysobacter sp. A378]